MAKPFSKAFYESRQWRKVSKAYALSQHYVCERCHNRSLLGKSDAEARFIVHHKIPLTPENINDPAIAYGWDNLELLCQACHNIVHSQGLDREAVFDADGNVIGIQDHKHTAY